MSHTILFIEDNPVISKLWDATLREGGFDVIVAENGEEGITLAIREKPDLILLDLDTPSPNGSSLLVCLKNQQATSKIPVMVLSNLTQHEEVQKARIMGACDCIVKSTVLPEQLVSKVKFAIAKNSGGSSGE